MEKRKNNIVKIVCIIIVVALAMLGVISIVKMIFCKDVASKNKSLKELAQKIYNVDKNVTIYESPNNNTLFVEFNNWSNSKANELNQIIQILKNETKKEEFKTYTKLITLAYLKTSEEQNELIVKHEYSLPGYVENTKNEYITFNAYEKLYNTLKQTTNSYTDLFNSIH